jgi:antitoxin MazE
VATRLIRRYNFVLTKEVPMQASIKRMGNSAAILLSKPVLAHLAVATGDVLDLNLLEGKVVLSPVQRHPRDGWAVAAQALAQAGDGDLEWPEFDNSSDGEWTW